MKVGDLVRVVQGYSKPGIIVKFIDATSVLPVKYIKVYWFDTAAYSTERHTMLEVINESR